jgi:hypothetical protein
MLSKLKGLGVWGEGNKDEILDLFAECLIAAQGQRRVKGLEATRPSAPAVQPAARMGAPLTPPATPIQPQHAPVHNPVHQQQQQVAQTFAPPQQGLQRQG